MGALLSAVGMISGPAKVTSGIAAAASKHFISDERRWQQCTVGAALGAAMAATLSVCGYGPANPAYFVGVSALAGGFGPLLGPRYSQTFRNLSKFFGTKIESVLGRSKPLNEKVRNCLGALPAGATKEGVAGLMYADGRLVGLLAGTLVEAVHLTAVLWLMDGKQAHSQEEPSR